jgi:hypothetical protein
MPLPSSGPLNMGGTSSPVSVAQELGRSLTATISMNESAVRTLAGVGGSGTTWSMNSLYGKSNGYAVEILAVGGGGSGSNYVGGGAGGMREVSTTIPFGTAYTVTIGGGGSGGGAGVTSSFGTLAVGGGGGGGSGANNGGSGAGNSFAAGGAGFSNAGGARAEAYGGGAGSQVGGGGGGGAGAAGGGGGASTGSYAAGGSGGVGRQWLDGTFYAGGGGGGATIRGWCFVNPSRGYGGNGGGGSGATSGYLCGGCSFCYYNYGDECSFTDGCNGSAFRGGGGGGSANGGSGGNGGSGIVIIRYPGAQRGTGGSVYSSGGYTYHVFTGSGTYNSGT